MHEYKSILELQLILFNENILNESFNGSTIREFLCEIQNNLLQYTYDNYGKRGIAIMDIGLLTLLKRDMKNEEVINHFDFLIGYICNCVQQSELLYFGEKVSQKLSSDNLLSETEDWWGSNDDDL